MIGVSMESTEKENDILESLFVIPREVPKTILRNLLELIYDVKVTGSHFIPETGVPFSYPITRIIWTFPFRALMPKERSFI